MSNAIASQFISHDLSGFATVTSQQTLEKPFSRSTVTLCLQVHINHVAVLIYGPPKIMLLPIDFHEHLIDEESVTIASMLSLQSSGVDGTKLDTPEADRFATDGDASFGKQIFDVAVTQIESVVEPNCVTDDVRWESVALVGIHAPILTISVSLLGSTIFWVVQKEFLIW